MKKKQTHIVLLVLCFLSYNGYSQINCTVPDPPVLTSVSVQTGTGNTDFTWTASPSSGIAAYILYSYKNGDGMPIDTIWDPLATSYSAITTATRYFSVSYVLASYRLPVIPGTDGCPSPLSNVLNTIFANANIDTCNNKIIVSWNSYSSIPKKVNGYSVLISANGGNYTEAVTVSPDINSFSISDFQFNAVYCFVIRANLEGGLFSTSNNACLSTKMIRPPGWINADFATINSDNNISLSFTIDPLSEITHFKLERKADFSGTFREIAQPVSVNGSVLFTDNKADIDSINYYRLSAINNCNLPVAVSNLCSNIVLSLVRSDNELNLSWNSNNGWLGLTSSYILFINTGKGFEEKVVLQPADTVFSIVYAEIMYEVSGSEVCFYVSASETSNPYGITGQCRSSVVCTVPSEIITVPNVFTPNNDLVNDFFRPVLSFTPVEYYLLISDRQGKKLFESRNFNEEWDGTHNGTHLSQGVCLWFLKVTAPSGRTISRTGTITIINSR
jgi:gliding motility-associated-like protein